MPEHVIQRGNYQVNGLNQYTGVAGFPTEYDTKGNLYKYDGARYEYDEENRLKKVTPSSGSATYLYYDPLGRLSRIFANAGYRDFLWDGDALVAEYTASGTTPAARYGHGVGTDVPILQMEGSSISSSNWQAIHADQRGSVVAYSNFSNNIIGTNSYDEYGIPGFENQGRFGFTGQLWIPEIGLYHYKARMYHPKMGRFLQTDPVGYEDQMNLYAYVYNDPMNNTDPSGECPMCISAVTGAIIGGVASMAVQAYQNNGNINWSVVGAATVSGALVGLTGGAAGAAVGAIGLTGAEAVATVAIPSAAVAYTGGAVTQIISNVESGSAMKGVQTAGVAAAVGTVAGAAVGQLETAALTQAQSLGGQGALSQAGKVVAEGLTTATQEAISQATSAVTSGSSCQNQDSCN